MPETAVTVNAVPRTIHDFGGFPRELYEVQYPAADAPELARRVQALLAPLPVKLDSSWGLDHGTWSVFRHVYPDADIPIVQLSIDERQSATAHFEIGRKLAALRVEGILIAGSGNLVHNLHTYAWDGTCLHPTIGQPVLKKIAKNLIISGEYRRLIEYESLGRDAMLSIPTPDHYLPLLYVIGARQDGEAVKFPIEGVDGGSISMLAVQIG